MLSCREQQGISGSTPGPGKNEMADLNKYLVQKDRERIKNYIERKNLKMNESPTGLWYQIIKEGRREQFTDNDKIVMDYECSLLDGTKCYSSRDTWSQRRLFLGKTEIEAGT